MTAMMRPGQLTPNAFELAILERIAADQPSILVHLGHLHVLSREFTGVGSFTNFQCGSGTDVSEQRLSLNASIVMPGVPSGMGAILFCLGDWPKCLETFTYGNDHWDGVFEGFRISGAVGSE